ncbi:ABC transporter ATP-binding protein, partial [Micromonospora zhanjiangensis]
MGSDHAITADGLRKRYAGSPALDGFDLQVGAGTIHGLLGPNGAGKSTAVKALATLIDLDAGVARIDGFDVRTRPGEVRRRIGLVGQHPAVDEILGGRQNLVMFGRLYGLNKTDARSRAAELLDTFGLTAVAERAVGTYSGGMRRRLDIAAGLILTPAVLFLDEPTTGLDPRARNEVWESVRDIAGRGTTVLLTTQYLDEADQLAGRISVLDHGRVVAEGTPDALK